MTQHTYTGAQLQSTLTRDTNTGATTYSAQTWLQGFAAPVLYESFVTDIRSAGDYELRIDGVTVASVAGVAAAATNVAFTPATPIELLPGDYTFALVCTSGAVTWYARGNIPDPGVGVGGTGWYVGARGEWAEPANGNAVPGEHRFYLADDARVAGIDHDTLSSGSFTGLSWTLTFADDVVLTGVWKRVWNHADTYRLSIDGVDVASWVKNSDNTSEDIVLAPPTPILLPAGAYVFRIYRAGGTARVHYDSGTGSTPAGSGAANVSGWSVWAESTGNKVPAKVWFRLPVEEPTSLTADNETTTTVDLEWSLPASGPTPAGYEYRIDGGTPVDVGNVTSTVVTGLDPDTSYLFEVRAYLSGDFSAWADVTTSTLDDEVPIPEGAYRIVLDVGIEHETVLADVTLGVDEGLPVLLPLTLGWDIADDELLPAQAGPTLLKFSLRYADSTLVPALVDKGQPCSFRMYVDDPDDPWQAFDGTIVQVDGEFVRRKKTTGEWDWRVDVVASSVGLLDRPLASTPVGLDEGDLTQRLDEIATEFPFAGGSGGIDYDPDHPLATTDDELGLFGAMVAADSFGPNSVLNHLRTILKWAIAWEEGDGTLYRWVFGYDPHENILRLRGFGRHTVGDDIINLDGDHVPVAGKWTKLLPDRLPGWGAVDGDVIGTPGTPPERGVMLSTVYLDATSGQARANIASFILLGPEFVQLDGWRTRSVRHLSYLDPEPWRLIFEGDGEPVARLRPVQISNLHAELRVDGSNYILGLLAGITLTIPPRGKHYMTVKLRPELPPGYEPPGDLDPPLDDEEE